MLSKTFCVISSKARNLANALGRRYSSGKLKFPSSQLTLSYRVGPTRDPSALRFVGMTPSLRF